MVFSACSVDVPNIDDESVKFLCDNNDDCAEGYGCYEEDYCKKICGDNWCEFVDTLIGQDNCIVPNCVQAGWECGALSDNCGGWVFCGECPDNQTCGGLGAEIGHCGDNILPGSAENPAGSCFEILQLSGGEATNDIYWVLAGGVASATPVQTYCDMSGGGWTLIGEVAGKFDMTNMWLRNQNNVNNLLTDTIEDGTFACIDAVAMAVNRAQMIRLSNTNRTRWVKWEMPPNRLLATWWNHNTGNTLIANAQIYEAVVKRWDGATESCRQNIFGVMPFDEHGGSFPYTSNNDGGNTTEGDLCMAVGVQPENRTIDGFTQNGNGFDAPIDDYDWPNASLANPPKLKVWLR
ncbi:MAG: hypothetical protein JW841_04980 [Deltaproteobacteria bacterium]|nr:hypothetical protein [Deltaproteobacteria bacterium]